MNQRATHVIFGAGQIGTPLAPDAAVHRSVRVGLVTSENIGEFLMIQAALKARAAALPVTTGPVTS